MKIIITLRFLCIIGFLLLFCPFYDSCNGKGIKEKATEVTEITGEVSTFEANSDLVITEDKKPFVEVKKTVLNNIYEFIFYKDTQNALEFAWISIEIFDNNFQDFINDILFT